MNNEKNNRIEQILNSLDGNQRAQVPEFFYTRLKARMERESSQKNRSNNAWILRPAYALITLMVVLIINIAVIVSGEQATYNNSTGDTETAQSIAAEYSLNDNNIMYDLTPDNK
jgi:hypothetical protein